MLKNKNYLVVTLTIILGLGLGSILDTQASVSSGSCGVCMDFENPSGGIDEYCDFTTPQVYFGCTGNNGVLCWSSPFCALNE